MLRAYRHNRPPKPGESSAVIRDRIAAARESMFPE